MFITFITRISGGLVCLETPTALKMRISGGSETADVLDMHVSGDSKASNVLKTCVSEDQR